MTRQRATSGLEANGGPVGGSSRSRRNEDRARASFERAGDTRRRNRAAGSLSLVVLLCGLGMGAPNCAAQTMSAHEQNELIARGRYLAIIGVCSACHTPPNVAAATPSAGSVEADRDRVFRTDPDWFKYLDPEQKNYLAGGVPFILRLGSSSSGIVVTTNITPDLVDGIGTWTEQEIADTIREGRRPKRAVTPDRPEFLYLFPPHTFYSNLAREDGLALAYYLKSLPPKKSAQPIPRRQLPEPVPEICTGR
jgi:hypothetical protein